MNSIEKIGHTRRLVTLVSVVLALACAALAGLLAQHRAAPRDLSASANAALPQLSGTLSVNGLTQPVEVLRDTWGVPHIFAKNTKDLFFAQGFTVAQDRMWQLEQRVASCRRRLDELRASEVAAFNELLRNRNIPPIITKVSEQSEQGATTNITDFESHPRIVV